MGARERAEVINSGLTIAVAVRLGKFIEFPTE